MNRIIKKLGEHWARGERVVRIAPDDPVSPNGIVVTVAEKEPISFNLGYNGDRHSFIKDWHETGRWLDLKWAKLD